MKKSIITLFSLLTICSTSSLMAYSEANCKNWKECEGAALLCEALGGYAVINIGIGRVGCN